MTPDEFDAFARELGARFKGTGTHWIVVVLPPGSYTGTIGPHSAGNLSVDAQIATLRGVADSLESNTATEVFRVRL